MGFEGNRYCKKCGTKLIKKGRTKNGKQQWCCKICNERKILTRNDKKLISDFQMF